MTFFNIETDKKYSNNFSSSKIVCIFAYRK
nr:MAG TPA: hypothetical protein [Caudoviricetes sp.]